MFLHAEYSDRLCSVNFKMDKCQYYQMIIDRHVAWNHRFRYNLCDSIVYLDGIFQQQKHIYYSNKKNCLFTKLFTYVLYIQAN